MAKSVMFIRSANSLSAVLSVFVCVCVCVREREREREGEGEGEGERQTSGLMCV